MKYGSRSQPPTLLLIVAGLLISAGATSAQQIQIESPHYAEFGVANVAIELNSVNGCCDPAGPMGHFSFLIQYDTTGLEFQSAAAGRLIFDCSWEYFLWAAGSNADCGGVPCSRDFIQIVATADIANGNQHPSCLLEVGGVLANLSFRVIADSTGDCQWYPIRFVWFDCDDNVLGRSPGADTIIVSDQVQFVDMYPEPPLDSTFPTQTGAPDACLSLGDGVTRLRHLSFVHGGVALNCSYDIPDRGDINLNGISYEIADAVMFSNYLVYGDTVFGDYYDDRFDNCDINADNDTATVDDLVYLWRIIIGDALPYPSPTKAGATDPAIVIQDPSTKTVSITYADSLYGMYLVFEGDVDLTPSINPDFIAWDSHDGRTNVLLFAIDLSGSLLPVVTGSTELFSYTGEGILRLAQASYDGVVDIPVDLQIPGCCVLRGDMDYSGEVNVGDITGLVEYLFQGGWAPVCPAHGDVDGSGSTDVSDLTALVAYLFSGGAAPAPCPM